MVLHQIGFTERWFDLSWLVAARSRRDEKEAQIAQMEADFQSWLWDNP